MAGLVSILTRTLGRDCLADAAASVAAQTYRPIEWVVVDAAGKGLDAPAAGDVPVRVVGAGRPLLRSPAANLAFDQARGTHALILDDDDLLKPACVERLAGALAAHPAHKVAYGDVEIIRAAGASPGKFSLEYSELMLTMRNMFPLNGGLFDLALTRDLGVRYDLALDWFEDWDFWLQCSRHTTFWHVREVTASYRMHLSQSGVKGVDEPGADPRIAAQRGAVAERVADRRRRAEDRHLELKRVAAEHHAAGRLREAAAGWVAAHASFQYDAEPILGYADVALQAGDVRAARAIVESGLGLLPSEPSLYRAYAKLLERAGDAAKAADAAQRAARLEAGTPPPVA